MLPSLWIDLLVLNSSWKPSTARGNLDFVPGLVVRIGCEFTGIERCGLMFLGIDE